MFSDTLNDFNKSSRKRIVFCDCIDCEPIQEQQQQKSSSSSSFQNINTSNKLPSEPDPLAAARQEPPPPCLLIYATSIIHYNEKSNINSIDESNIPHIDTAVKQGGAGILALRKSTFKKDNPEMTAANTIAQLFKIYEEMEKNEKIVTLGERFHDIKVALCSNVIETSPLTTLAKVTDISQSFFYETKENGILPDPEELANEISKIIGIKKSEKMINEMDMFILHIDVNTLNKKRSDKISEFECACQTFEYIDNFLKCFNNIKYSKQSVYLCMVFGGFPDTVQDFLVPGGKVIMYSGVKIYRPVQSFERNGLNKVDVSLSTPTLVVRRLNDVVRIDEIQKLNVKEFSESGAYGAILIDHLFPDIAYKLGKMSKYGS